MSIHCVDYGELESSGGTWICPSCGDPLSVYPQPARENPAFLLCTCCDAHWVDTVGVLRWLAGLNQSATNLFPGSNSDKPPNDNFAFMLGGGNPDNGRRLRVDKLLQYIADMLEE